MKWKRIIGVIAAIVVVALIVFKLKTNKEIAQDKVYQYDKEEAIPIQTVTLKLENVNDEFSYTGTFEPNKETKVSAEVQGKINVVLVDVGNLVKKGQHLLKLDDVLLREQLNIIETQIANITAEKDLKLQANQIQLDALKADIDRYSILAKANAIQGVQLEKAQVQVQSAQNQRQMILQQSALKNAMAQKSQILHQIGKTTIKAPFSGIVTAKLSEAGAFAAPGVPLLQITDIAKLKFTVNVPEDDLSNFKLDQNYIISTDAYPEITLSGKTSMIGSKANMGSSFPVQFNVDNTSDLIIKSGMFGTVVLEEKKQEKGILIPATAVQGNANQPQVYLVKNGKSALTDITISKKILNKVVVSSGLEEGDVLVTNGFINLFDGANVATKN